MCHTCIVSYIKHMKRLHDIGICSYYLLPTYCKLIVDLCFPKASPLIRRKLKTDEKKKGIIGPIVFTTLRYSSPLIGQLAFELTAACEP